MRVRKLPSVDRLRELLRYDAESGNLYWNVPRKGARHGVPAGFIDAEGYRKICVDSVLLMAHRVCWAMITGEWPSDDLMIDHADGVRSHNSESNLRLADSSVNQQNQRGPHADSKTGLFGIKTVKRKSGPSRFTAQIWIDGRQVHLGTFDTAELAHHEYMTAKRKFHDGCTI